MYRKIWRETDVTVTYVDPTQTTNIYPFLRRTFVGVAQNQLVEFIAYQSKALATATKVQQDATKSFFKLMCYMLFLYCDYKQKFSIT